MSAAVSEPRHVYHVSPWRRWILAWVFGPFLLGALVMAALLPGEGRMIGGIMFGLMLAIALAGQWLIDRSKLVLSPAGVMLRHTGCTFESPWTNIAEMRVDRGLEAFITWEPVGGKGQNLFAASAATGALPYFDQRHQQLLDEGRLIPFEAFAWHLRNGEIRAQIENFAPHLRASLAVLDSPVATPLVSLSKGRKWIGIGLFVALIVGIFWLILSPKVNRPLLETGLGTAVLAAAAIQSFYSARAYFKRRLWIWGVVLAVLGVVFALWTLGMVVQLSGLLRGGG